VEIQYIFGNPRRGTKKALASKKKSRKNKKTTNKSSKGQTMAKKSKSRKMKHRKVSLRKNKNPVHFLIKSKGTVVGPKGMVKKGITGRTKSVFMPSEKAKLKKEYKMLGGMLTGLRKRFAEEKGNSKLRSAIAESVTRIRGEQKKLARAMNLHRKNSRSVKKALEAAQKHGSTVAGVTTTQSINKFLGEKETKVAKKKSRKKGKAKKAKTKKAKAKKVKTKGEAKKAKAKKVKAKKVKTKGKAKKAKTKKAKTSRRKKRKSSSRRKTSARAKVLTNKKIQYKMSTIEPRAKKKKSKKVKYKVRGKKRTVLMSLKRLNPFGGNMNKQLKDFTGLETKEAGYLVGGSVASDLIEKLSRKYLGAYIGQLDSMVPGGVKAVNALVVGAVAAATHKYAKNTHAKEMARAIIVAQIVKLGSSLTDMVAKPLGLSGVDYTPLNGIPYGLRGVDYTPLSGRSPQMAGVNFIPSLSGATAQMAGATPQMGYGADFGAGYDVSDYGGGGGYTQDRKFSAADFGGMDDDGEPTLDQSGSLI
jgi:hypothetical protein